MQNKHIFWKLDSGHIVVGYNSIVYIQRCFQLSGKSSTYFCSNPSSETVIFYAYELNYIRDSSSSAHNRFNSSTEYVTKNKLHGHKEPEFVPSTERKCLDMTRRKASRGSRSFNGIRSDGAWQNAMDANLFCISVRARPMKRRGAPETQPSAHLIDMYYTLWTPKGDIALSSLLWLPSFTEFSTPIAYLGLLQKRAQFQKYCRDVQFVFLCSLPQVFDASLTYTFSDLEIVQEIELFSQIPMTPWSQSCEMESLASVHINRLSSSTSSIFPHKIQPSFVVIAVTQGGNILQ